MSWSDFTDSNRLMTISHPTDWNVIEEGALQLVSPAGSALTFSLLRGPQAGNVQTLLDDKPVAGPLGHVGRSWMLSRANVYLMLTYFAAPSAAEAERGTVDTIVASIHLAPEAAHRSGWLSRLFHRPRPE